MDTSSRPEGLTPPYSVRPPIWVDSRGDADRVVATLRNYPTVGYDSEFGGVNLRTESCVGRANVDVFSVAVPSGDVDGLGFRRTESWVLDGQLLVYAPVKEWLEDPAYTKVIHNMPVDAHAAANSGVKIRGGLNTLSFARWVWPHRANLVSGNYDLDSLCQWKIGQGKLEDFMEVFGYDAIEAVQVTVPRKFCLGCQSFECRKRKEPHDKKVEREFTGTMDKKVRRVLPLSTVRPGGKNAHLFARYLAYSAADAELGHIIYEMALLDARQERYYPWAP